MIQITWIRHLLVSRQTTFFFFPFGLLHDAELPFERNALRNVVSSVYSTPDFNLKRFLIIPLRRFLFLSLSLDLRKPAGKVGFRHVAFHIPPFNVLS